MAVEVVELLSSDVETALNLGSLARMSVCSLQRWLSTLRVLHQPLRALTMSAAAQGCSLLRWVVAAADAGVGSAGLLRSCPWHQVPQGVNLAV